MARAGGESTPADKSTPSHFWAVLLWGSEGRGQRDKEKETNTTILTTMHTTLLDINTAQKKIIWGKKNIFKKNHFYIYFLLDFYQFMHKLSFPCIFAISFR